MIRLIYKSRLQNKNIINTNELNKQAKDTVDNVKTLDPVKSAEMADSCEAVQRCETNSDNI